MPANDMVHEYLAVFENKGTFPHGLAYRKALEQLNFDYTPESLKRVDALLRQMREKLKPDFTEWLDKPDHQTFLYLLCFYVGMVVVRTTGDSFAWYGREELKQVAPPEFLAEVPESFQTSMVLMLKGGGRWFPLIPIGEILFDPDAAPDRSIEKAAMGFIAGMQQGAQPGAQPQAVPVVESRIIEAPAPGFALPTGDPVTKVMADPARLSGFTAAFVLSLVAQGMDVPLALHYENPLGKRQTVQIAYSIELKDAIARMEANEWDARFTAFSYESAFALPSGTARCLMMELRSFGITAMSFAVAFPFLDAADGRSFTLARPRLLKPLSLTDRGLELFAAGLYDGITQFNPKDFWPAHLDPTL